ncbi:MAG: hypothetical protein OQK09_03850 [Colwellia sp.]|nr:hypothetical protein [Colwellia sp.]MCW8866477.1 hypothetical protein [Colwellia sp.]MCW9080621.1 hypothetical protein [Colwellia sp.]
MKKTKMNINKGLLSIVSRWKALLSPVLVLLLALPMSVSAHVLKETSARVTLRDGQVEVRLWVDMQRWKTRLQDNQAWLLGDIQQVMPSGLTPKETNLFIKNLLNKEVSLTLNNQAVSLKLLTTPNTKTVTNHHDYTELVFSSNHPFSLVEQLNIHFPKSLGAVHASFVKPKYQMLAAGSNTTISFAAQRGQTTPVASHHSNNPKLTKFTLSNSAEQLSTHAH